MELSVRLQLIADHVIPGNRVVDVGTDHAHLPIYLVERGIIPSALASDVRKGPITHARENICSCNLEALIETRLSDGLKEVRPGEGDTLIIAGMGGILTRMILEQSSETAKSMEQWILEPQSDADLVRSFVYEVGYHIAEEVPVREGSKFYTIMDVRRGRADMPSDAELRFGPILLRKKDPLLMEYLHKEEKMLRHILEELYRNDTEKTRARAMEKERELAIIKEAKSYYEMQ